MSPGTLADRLDLAAWPGSERREPQRSDKHYLVLSALVEQMAAEVERHFPGRTDLRVLDVGCGVKPYLPLVADRAVSYRGMDVVAGPHVDDVGTADALPYGDESYDLVICTQVLEHVPDPLATVREIRRVLAPGGAALMSTHGVFVYHPAPPESDQDYWRWTHSGLARLVSTAGEWSDVRVLANRNVIACLAYLVSWYLDDALARVNERLRRVTIGSLNRLAAALDSRYPAGLRVPAPGSMSANYLVSAKR